MLYLKKRKISNSGMGETVRPCIHRCLFEYVCTLSQNISSKRYLFSFENIQKSRQIQQSHDLTTEYKQLCL